MSASVGTGKTVVGTGKTAKDGVQKKKKAMLAEKERRQRLFAQASHSAVNRAAVLLQLAVKELAFITENKAAFCKLLKTNPEAEQAFESAMTVRTDDGEYIDPESNIDCVNDHLAAPPCDEDGNPPKQESVFRIVEELSVDLTELAGCIPYW